HIDLDTDNMLTKQLFTDYISSQLEPLVSEKFAEQCQWIKEVEEGVYETDCKHSFQFISDGVKENHFNHCPYCGKPIIEIDLTEDYGRFDEESDKQAEGL